MKRLQNTIEQYTFGVCTKVAEKLGISTSAVRLFFIYASFITYGSPVIMYLALAFVLNLRKYYRKKRSYYYDL